MVLSGNLRPSLISQESVQQLISNVCTGAGNQSWASAAVYLPHLRSIIISKNTHLGAWSGDPGSFKAIEHTANSDQPAHKHFLRLQEREIVGCYKHPWQRAAHCKDPAEMASDGTDHVVIKQIPLPHRHVTTVVTWPMPGSQTYQTITYSDAALTVTQVKY